MIISRDRHFDDSSLLRASVVFQAGTREMHSLVSDAPEDVRAAVGDVLVDALNRIQALLAPVVERRRTGDEARHFGCGT